MLLLKNITFTILVPGTVTVMIPYWIIRNFSVMPLQWEILHYFALVPALLGVSIYLRCVWDFATVGRGTPAPIDPPKNLVVRGLFRYVRNPMYIGGLFLLLAEALFFRSKALLVYALAIFVIFHLFVVFYEEPVLERKFGMAYRLYRQHVRRWIPGKRYEEP
jgi:protein-S-isoprenylcysteine O-methyltransferase Ste14